MAGEAKSRLHGFLIELGGISRTLPGLVFGMLRLEDFLSRLGEENNFEQLVVGDVQLPGRVFVPLNVSILEERLSPWKNSFLPFFVGGEFC